jgi:hypothetical protein
VYTPGYYLSTGVEGAVVTHAHASYSESDGMDGAIRRFQKLAPHFGVNKMITVWALPPRFEV